MKNLYLSSLIALFGLQTFGQSGIDNLWIMGRNGNPPWGPVNIDFVSGVPNVYSASRPMNIYPTNGLISDTSGNLLFYTNGCYIANALNDTMFNGSGLNPGECTDEYCPSGETVYQGNLVLPAPGFKNKYYLFHEVCDQNAVFNALPYPTKLYYSVIDMEQQGGLGAVIEKNVVIINTSDAVALNRGFLTATKHANGRDWWIVVHGRGNNLFYILLLSPFGVQGPFTQLIGPTGEKNADGMTIFSPDGNKLATCAWTDIDTSGYAIPQVHLFDFDRCTGQLYNYRYDSFHNLPPYTFGGGIAISPNSRYLYFSGGSFGLMQYDLLAPNLDSTSRVEILHDTNSTANLFLGSLAYDKKIYFVGPGILNFSSVNYPDSGGLACNFQLQAIQLQHYNIGTTVPNYPNYRLGVLIGSSCDTITDVNEKNAFQLKLNVYPNPSEKGVFHFKFNDVRERIKELEVTDIIGRVIYSLDKNSYEINISNLAIGVYFYSVKTDSGKLFNGKLIRE